MLEKCYNWTRNVSENHISPDPVNFLTKAEMWNILLYNSIDHLYNQII